MSLFAPATPRQRDIALTVLRVIAGTVFLAHGVQMLFSFSFAGIAGAFGQMGFPMPAVLGPVVAFAELAGGVALIFGFLTRLAALGLAAIMLGAVLFVHLRNGFFLPNGMEFALAMFGATTALFLMGAGTFSLDALLARRAGRAAAASSSDRVRRAA
jgi:putative oxidoreductase